MRAFQLHSISLRNDAGNVLPYHDFNRINQMFARYILPEFPIITAPNMESMWSILDAFLHTNVYPGMGKHFSPDMVDLEVSEFEVEGGALIMIGLGYKGIHPRPRATVEEAT